LPASNESQGTHRRTPIKAHLFFALSLLLLFPPAGFSSPSSQAPGVATALQKLDANNLDEHWYFTMALVQDGEQRVIQSDPLRSKYERRQLLSVNGSTPDEKRQKEFREAEKKRIDEQDPDTIGFEYLVDINTLQLIENTEGSSTFSFSPRVNRLDGARDKLRGSLSLLNATQEIEEIEIFNTEELSPAFSVTLERFRLTFQFQLEQGRRLLHKMESHTAGKVGFLKRFDSKVVIDFSEYQQAKP
jgi:hypothetical protein